MTERRGSWRFPLKLDFGSHHADAAGRVVCDLFKLGERVWQDSQKLRSGELIPGGAMDGNPNGNSWVNVSNMSNSENKPDTDQTAMSQWRTDEIVPYK